MFKGGSQHVQKNSSGIGPNLRVSHRAPNFAGSALPEKAKIDKTYTSRKWVFDLAPKSHLSRLGLSMGTNDRHWSRFVPFGGRSRFITENRSQFMA
jgi:hypothetical protein